MKYLWQGMERIIFGIISIVAICCGIFLLKQIPDVAGFAVLWKLFKSVICFLIGVLFLYITGCDE